MSADLAVRRRLESKLRQQEQILRAMFSQAIVGIAQLDTAGRFNLVNNRFCEIVGRPAPQLLQTRIEDIAVPEDAPYLRDLLRQAIQTGEGFAIEIRHVLPDGSRLWLRNNVSAITDQSGAVRHLMAVLEDVTARRKAEEGLQRAHDDLQKATGGARGDASPRPPNSFTPRSSNANASRPRSSTTSPSAARRKRR